MRQEAINQRLAAFFKSHPKDLKLSSDEFQFFEAALTGSHMFSDGSPLLTPSQFTPFSVRHTPLHIPVPPNIPKQSVKKLEISRDFAEQLGQEVKTPAKHVGNFESAPPLLDKEPESEPYVPSPPRAMTQTAQSLIESIMSPVEAEGLSTAQQPDTRPVEHRQEQKPCPFFAFDLSSYSESKETFDAKGLPSFSFELY